MSENQAVLNFSIQEAVWFQKGQEVAEILSVQLTPDISINQEGDYVYIRGSLFLEGEYKAIIAEEDEYSLRDISPHRTVEDVVTREDGCNEFYHNFPVDISIPVDRIAKLEDIYVDIESFDYELNDQSNLRLIADILIGGLQEENRQPQEQKEYEAYQVQIPIQETQQEEVEEETPVSFEPFRIEVKNDPYLEERPIQKREWEGLSAFGGFEPASQPPISQPLNNPVIEPVQYDYPKAVPIEPVAAAQPNYYNVPRYAESKGKKQKKEEVAEAIAPETYDEQYARDYPPQDENALYLTKLFSREEDEFAQLRMYFVQPGDTVESIAEHYGVKVDSIMRANSLEDNYVSTGKILYIPKGKKHHI